MQQWWKSETKSNPQNFLFEILEILPEIFTPTDLITKEIEFQNKFEVLTEEYFNSNIHPNKFVSKKNSRTKESKEKTSNSLRAFYKTKKGIEKRKQISEQNKKLKPNQLKGVSKSLDHKNKLSEAKKLYWASLSKEERSARNTYKNNINSNSQ